MATLDTHFFMPTIVKHFKEGEPLPEKRRYLYSEIVEVDTGDEDPLRRMPIVEKQRWHWYEVEA